MGSSATRLSESPEEKSRIGSTADHSLSPAGFVINAALKSADKRCQQATDNERQALAIGQMSLFGNDDPILNMVVVLERGFRKIYRYLTPQERDWMRNL
jgi:hypothetical protein